MEFYNVILRKENKDINQSEKKIKKSADNYIKIIKNKKNKLRIIGDIKPDFGSNQTPLMNNNYMTNMPNFDVGNVMDNIIQNEDIKKHFEELELFYNDILQKYIAKLSDNQLNQESKDEITDNINSIRFKQNELKNISKTYTQIISGHKANYTRILNEKKDLENEYNEIAKKLQNEKELTDIKKEEYENKLKNITLEMNKLKETNTELNNIVENIKNEMIIKEKKYIEEKVNMQNDYADYNIIINDSMINLEKNLIDITNEKEKLEETLNKNQKKWKEKKKEKYKKRIEEINSEYEKKINEINKLKLNKEESPNSSKTKKSKSIVFEEFNQGNEEINNINKSNKSSGKNKDSESENENENKSNFYSMEDNKSIKSLTSNKSNKKLKRISSADKKDGILKNMKKSALNIGSTVGNVASGIKSIGGAVGGAIGNVVKKQYDNTSKIIKSGKDVIKNTSSKAYNKLGPALVTGGKGMYNMADKSFDLGSTLTSNVVLPLTGMVLNKGIDFGAYSINKVGQGFDKIGDKINYLNDVLKDKKLEIYNEQDNDINLENIIYKIRNLDENGYQTLYNITKYTIINNYKTSEQNYYLSQLNEAYRFKNYENLAKIILEINNLKNKGYFGKLYSSIFNTPSNNSLEYIKNDIGLIGNNILAIEQEMNNAQNKKEEKDLKKQLIENQEIKMLLDANLNIKQNLLKNEPTTFARNPFNNTSRSQINTKIESEPTTFLRYPKRQTQDNIAYKINSILSKYYNNQLYKLIKDYQKENNIKGAEGIYQNSAGETLARYIIEKNINLNY